MLSVVSTTAILGIDAKLVQVEVDFSRGLPYFSIVGLPDLTVKESKERIELAIKHSGFKFPQGRIIVNLAPADVKKEGASFDLPIAVGILLASGIIQNEDFNGVLLGELSLDGSVKPVSGILPSAILVSQLSNKSILVPEKNELEAAAVPDISVYSINHLREIPLFYSGTRKQIKFIPPKKENNKRLDFLHVKGQQNVKRALEIAVAGGHNMLMIGTPGSGKSLMAKTLPTIFPELTYEEMLETTRIYSVKGQTSQENPIISERPFRAPHHSISEVGLIGGGSNPMPGEISLAHNGVLFLDEITEFKRNIINAFRQPLEDKKITISRAKYSVTFPCNFMLVAACNPCPCGNRNHPYKECNCTSLEIKRYMAKLSGPILDRIDIQVQVNPVSEEELKEKSSGEPSEVIRKRVTKAVSIQKERNSKKSGYLNSMLSDAEIKDVCCLNKESEELLLNAVKRFGLSARSYNRILKLSRTIADLESSKEIERYHVAEAIQYRCFDSFQ